MPRIWTGCCLAETDGGHRPGQGKNNSRAVAARLLRQLAQGRSLSDLLDRGLSGVEERDVGLVKEFCFGVARWRLRLEEIADRLLKRPLKERDGDVRALILVGLYQLLYMRVAPHAALSETVEAARALKKPWTAGLINAVLRRFLREREGLLEAVDRLPTARYAHPVWLLTALQQAWPGNWEALVDEANSRPPMSLRVNLSRVSRGDYIEQLAQAGVVATPVDAVPSAVVLDKPVDATSLVGFAAGMVSVQDAGAQLAAGLLDMQTGQHILDACAAPGGKTGHLLETAPAGVSVTAVDVDAGRLRRLQENLDRLRLSADVQVGNAASPDGEWARKRYDRILMDVPCSATGVIRRHPDIKWLRRAEDISSLTVVQARILDAVWPLLKPGGMLLYATCSLLPEENHEQVARCLEKYRDVVSLQIEAPWGHSCQPGRQTLPGEATMDGFYYARLQKTAR